MKGIVNALGKLSWGKSAYAVFVLYATAAIPLPAQNLTTLYSFDGAHGANPHAALIQGTNGNLYGTTEYAGAGVQGTVFEITPSGAVTTLHGFYGTDGGHPLAGLVQGTEGDFYGTTPTGGANNNRGCAYGCGTIFKITPSGTLTTVYDFCSQSNCSDGWKPTAGLTAEGIFYGTTQYGGDQCTDGGGCGTVFKITPSGTLTSLYSFTGNAAQGRDPAGLVHATNGDYYGTSWGSSSEYNGSCYYGCGTVFKITSSGTETTLYSFCAQVNCTDGGNPSAGLVQGADGNLYGTTDIGGDNCAPAGCGTVFKITPSGTLTTLYSFSGPDGSSPQTTLIQATDGNLYGTTASGGANAQGTVFKITPSGTLTTLYSFCAQSGCTDGAGPEAALVQGTDGNFYGTTYGGGANNYGTVFSLSVDLGPFVETQTTAGPVGSLVKILGTNLTGSTGVTFNGTAAVFSVSASSLITATVPAGASSGKVQVITPSGTLSSNVPFQVVP